MLFVSLISLTWGKHNSLSCYNLRQNIYELRIYNFGGAKGTGAHWSTARSPNCKYIWPKELCRILVVCRDIEEFQIETRGARCCCLCGHVHKCAVCGRGYSIRLMFGAGRRKNLKAVVIQMFLAWGRFRPGDGVVLGPLLPICGILPANITKQINKQVFMVSHPCHRRKSRSNGSVSNGVLPHPHHRAVKMAVSVCSAGTRVNCL